MAKQWMPPPNTVGERTVKYFFNNPSEELFIDDIAEKFDCIGKSVRVALGQCVAHELLRRSTDSAGRVVYSAGPAILQPDNGKALQDALRPSAVGGFKDWLRKKGEASAEGAPKRTPLQDPTTIEIEDGIPMPTALRVVDTRVDALFMKMQPGQSFKVLADSAKRYIQRAHKFGKAAGRKFALRTRPEDGTGYQRIYRVE